MKIDVEGSLILLRSSYVYLSHYNNRGHTAHRVALLISQKYSQTLFRKGKHQGYIEHAILHHLYYIAVISENKNVAI